MARNKTAPKSLIQLVFDEDGLEFRIKDTPKGYNLYSLSKSPQQIYYLVVIKAAYEDYIIEKKEDCRLFIGPNEDLEEIAIVEYRCYRDGLTDYFTFESNGERATHIVPFFPKYNHRTGKRYTTLLSKVKPYIEELDALVTPSEAKVQERRKKMPNTKIKQNYS